MRKSPAFTYGKLDRLLKQLGFDRLVGDGYLVYQHANGAVIPLPDMDKTTQVRPIHALAVRKTLELNGFDQLTYDVPL